MADFSKAISKVAEIEGGYINDPDDSGGETYKGISRIYNPDWIGWDIVDSYRKVDGFPKDLDYNETLQSLIKNLYKAKYWDTIKGDLILNQLCAESIFDFGVNAGVNTSVRLAQSILGTSVDGIFGPKTLDCINSCNYKYFICEFALLRIESYSKIIDNKSSNSKFFYGWVKRALKIYRNSLNG